MLDKLSHWYLEAVTLVDDHPHQATVALLITVPYTAVKSAFWLFGR